MSKTEFIRPHATELLRRLDEPRRFLQVIAEARQVGKSTLIAQVAAKVGLPHHIASADEPTLRGFDWIEVQWEAARLLAAKAGKEGAFLVLDDRQEVPR